MKFELFSPFALRASKGFAVQRRLEQAQPERGMEPSMGRANSFAVIALHGSIAVWQRPGHPCTESEIVMLATRFTGLVLPDISPIRAHLNGRHDQETRKNIGL